MLSVVRRTSTKITRVSHKNFFTLIKLDQFSPWGFNSQSVANQAIRATETIGGKNGRDYLSLSNRIKLQLSQIPKENRKNDVDEESGIDEVLISTISNSTISEVKSGCLAAYSRLGEEFNKKDIDFHNHKFVSEGLGELLAKQKTNYKNLQMSFKLSVPSVEGDDGLSAELLQTRLASKHHMTDDLTEHSYSFLSRLALYAHDLYYDLLAEAGLIQHTIVLKCFMLIRSKESFEILGSELPFIDSKKFSHKYSQKKTIRNHLIGFNFTIVKPSLDEFDIASRYWVEEVFVKEDCRSKIKAKTQLMNITASESSSSQTSVDVDENYGSIPLSGPCDVRINSFNTANLGICAGCLASSDDSDIPKPFKYS